MEIEPLQSPLHIAFEAVIFVVMVFDCASICIEKANKNTMFGNNGMKIVFKFYNLISKPGCLKC